MSVQLWICAGYTALCIEYWWLHWIMERRTLPQDQDQEAPLTLGWHQSCFLIILSAFLLYYQLCWWRWAEENSDCGNCCVLTVCGQLLCHCEEHVGWQRSMGEYSSSKSSFFLIFTVMKMLLWFLFLFTFIFCSIVCPELNFTLFCEIFSNYIKVLFIFLLK